VASDDKSLQRLSDNLLKLGKSVEQNVRAAMRAAVLLCDQVVVIGTPFDTGRARGGWQVTFDAPATAETGVLDPSGGQTLAKNAEDASKFEVGQELFLSNVVPYIGRLESGSSRQAPAGFLKQGAAVALAYLGKKKYLTVTGRRGD